MDKSHSLVVAPAPAPEAPAPACPEISEATYEWSAKLFSIFRRLLRVNLNFHAEADLIERADIFLFNHFSRFETFIPQYLFYRSAGVYCRAIAGSEFFEAGDALSSYLLKVGAVPNDMPSMLSFLAREVLHGRKIIVFPEGGMVKDRKVVDAKGRFRIYSRTAADRRKHHSGAAVLGLAIHALKRQVLRDAGRAGDARVARWADELGFSEPGALLAVARRPTVIVPANITFYPLRVDDNVLRRAAEMFSKGLSPRMTEELLIEGNILFRDTDMDIRFGELLEVEQEWLPGEHRVFSRVRGPVVNWQWHFDPASGTGWRDRIVRVWLQHKINRLRDHAMRQMYAATTVNLSHLASVLILELVERGVEQIAVDEFHHYLYLSIKSLQTHEGVHLHAGLLDPDAYGGLLEGEAPELARFMEAKVTMALLTRDHGAYRFLPKLLASHDFDEIRLENLVAVYANEVAPVQPVARAVRAALAKPAGAGPERAQRRFDDQLRRLDCDRRAYSGPKFESLSDARNATEDPAPFLLFPVEDRHSVGVLLIHGFLASPAEIRGFGERLCAAGYTVMGVRLRGHGTSPWDLRDRPWESWYASVVEGYRTLAEVKTEICTVGFSTGASLALRLAAEGGVGGGAGGASRLVGVVSVSAALRFRSQAMRFVPLVHGANRLVRWVSAWEGVMPFRENVTENPHINYRHMPIRGLYELRRLGQEVSASLSKIRCPVYVLQGDEDPVVDASSVEVIGQRVDPGLLQVQLVRSQRPGILYRDVDHTQQRIEEFIDGLEARAGPERGPAREARPA